MQQWSGYPPPKRPWHYRHQGLTIALVLGAVGAVILGVALVVGTRGSDSDWQDQLGCIRTRTEATQELFVQAKYVCSKPDDRSDTDVYTFANSDAKENWKHIAEQFGVVVLNEGDTWLETRD